ncbi:MAG: hypothetical protein QG646_437 [Euryarchaeota archaeon]|nr:hypothetical protein [Euryarchaeota archaeon]
MDGYENICDAEETSDRSRLVVLLNEQNPNLEYMEFLKTLEGIEFGPVTFDGNDEFGASFLNTQLNHDKFEEAGYPLMISGTISISEFLKSVYGSSDCSPTMNRIINQLLTEVEDLKM